MSTAIFVTGFAAGVGFCLGIAVCWALVIAARSGAGEAEEEVDPTEHQANEAMREAAEQAKVRICAWCHPGIDHAAGHGICQRHRDEMLAQAKEPRK